MKPQTSQTCYYCSWHSFHLLPKWLENDSLNLFIAQNGTTILCNVTILSLMKLQNYIVWWMLLHFLKLLVVSLFHAHLFFLNFVLKNIFLSTVWKLQQDFEIPAHNGTWFELIHAYSKSNTINITTVAIVLVLLPQDHNTLAVNNFFFFWQTLQDEYCVFFWYLERKPTIININYNEM